MRAKFPWAKFLLGFGLYLYFHEIDRLLPGSIIGTILGEGIESVYAHMKMLFYAYLILSIIDFFRLRKAGLPVSFFHARMLILAAVPWMRHLLRMWDFRSAYPTTSLSRRIKRQALKSGRRQTLVPIFVSCAKSRLFILRSAGADQA